MEKRNKSATIRDIARNVGVSVSTVSRHINNSGYVDRDTAVRIADSIRVLNYEPSLAAQGLKTQKSKIILLVVPDICNPFYSTIAKTTQRIVSEKGYALALYDSEDSRSEPAAVKLAQQMYASGVLMGSIDIKPETVGALIRASIPVVALNVYHQYPFDAVHVQGSEGSYIATRHLISGGHKRIGFAGGEPGSMIGRSRREGYERAMAEAGLIPLSENIIERGFAQSDGIIMGEYFASLPNRPTAICCANDLIALGLLSALHEHKIAVPEEVSVVGMDDIPYACISSPSLSSVTNDGACFAQEGMRMLFERIEGTYEGAPRSVSISHQLIVRGSTSANRC
ncbi:MAG: LacI family transcriptional regulator [Oscillospiraceae bacterium]|nr:LacI family transcriptional regulator [Oscillospiraceae bacterium]